MTGMPRLAGRRSRWLIGQCTRGERQSKHHARSGEQQVAWHGSGSLQAVIAACFTFKSSNSIMSSPQRS
ncbi:MAG: hypothetical protein VB131_08175 [Burkholderia gladioli]